MENKYSWLKKDDGTMSQIIHQVAEKFDMPPEHVAFFYDDFCRYAKKRLKMSPLPRILMTPLGNIIPVKSLVETQWRRWARKLRDQKCKKIVGFRMIAKLSKELEYIKRK